MRSIAIINQKGGVGKTTTAVNLSAALAKLGKSVCLVDMDPQAHATLHLGFGELDNEPTMYDVMLGHASLDDVATVVRDGLQLAPSHLDLAAAELELLGEVGREMILREQLQRAKFDVDYVIIDCPPSLSVLTVNALVGVREVFLPLQPQFLALHGLSKLLGTIELVSGRLNPGLQLTGVMFCMYQSGTRLTNEVVSDVESFFAAVEDPRCPWARARVFSTQVRRNIRLAEAPSHGETIFEYAPSSHGAEDYLALAQEVMQSSEGRLAHPVTSVALEP